MGPAPLWQLFPGSHVGRVQRHNKHPVSFNSRANPSLKLTSLPLRETRVKIRQGREVEAVEDCHNFVILSMFAELRICSPRLVQKGHAAPTRWLRVSPITAY